MNTPKNSIVALSSIATLAIAAPAFALPTQVQHADLPHCDPLIVPDVVDELGLAPLFPVPCSVSADAQPITQPACPLSDNTQIPNAAVRMTNTSGRDFAEVWYVGDEATGFTNFDGTVNGFEAFRIDAVGGNKPLIFESIAADGIFQAGETWQFIVQDYGNAGGLSPAAFSSIGVPSLGGVSAASIIAREVPTPGAATLLALSGLATMRRRR